MTQNLMSRRALLGSLLATYVVCNVDTALGQQPIFRNGLQGPTPQLFFAQNIERSLALDPSGRGRIPITTDSFATPLDVYETLRRLNPHAGPTFYDEHPTAEQLRMMVVYIRTLVLRRLTATSRFYNTTIGRRRDGSPYIIYDNTNTLRAGVEVLEDPHTRDAIFKRDCGNGLGQCVYIDFEVKDAAEFAVLWGRYVHASDHCFAWRRVSRPYENDTDEARWNRVDARRICGDCDLGAANQVLGRTPAAEGTLSVTPGHYQFRLIRREQVVLCLLHWQVPAGLRSENRVVSSTLVRETCDARRAANSADQCEPRGSFDVDISWSRGDYERHGEEWHARVYYASDDLRRAGIPLGNGPKSLLWYASNDADEAAMHRFAREPRRGESYGPRPGGHH